MEDDRPPMKNIDQAMIVTPKQIVELLIHMFFSQIIPENDPVFYRNSRRFTNDYHWKTCIIKLNFLTKNLAGFFTNNSANFFKKIS